MRATLAEVLQPALSHGYAVAGMVCLGWEDMRAYVTAAESEDSPVILQAGPGCREHTPLSVLASMMGQLADQSSVPVVLHLDHGYSADECREAIECGFTSVMFDGSAKPLDENIEETAAIAALAHRNGVSCEGEIGFVGYAQGEVSRVTDPVEAARFASETGVDAMAISIGNVHLQRQAGTVLDEPALAAIEAATQCPLVIHGGSGVPENQRKRLARGSAICKFNIGTQLRQCFGQSLRRALTEDPDMFDRNTILKRVEPALGAEAVSVYRALGSAGKGSVK
ncbi:MAG: class II fructose-bisphosphate aldolase [Ahrensia sp.]|nr:class II fructose-bisphosphate aldolase [Ahrensia sp.]